MSGLKGRCVNKTLKWLVTINECYSYKVEGDYAAEAASEAVREWRKDERVQIAYRRAFITHIQTECLDSDAHKLIRGKKIRAARC